MKLITSRGETYHFVRGASVALSVDGSWIEIRNAKGRLTWRGFWYLARQRITRPFRRGTVVSAVDHETGTITLSPAPKRWWHIL